ncbi:helix-turn-helix domain-containing protein [Microvirga antarctica]|uniref:helix-turn-helix domain-containing protein n=1 Tax=Microvirga antarctica TaxID=2819233 RepID=UPI001FE28DBE|nr:helix-turn-helix domain-containing protein [Microvirga antarctica]
MSAPLPLPRDHRATYRKSCGICADCNVRHMAICDALEDQNVDRLERIMTARSLQANEILVEEGDPRQKVFSLASGMLRLYSDLPDGRRQIAGFLLPGDYLGLADDDTYSQTAEAVIPSTLCAFPIRDMDALMEEFPRLKDRLHVMTRTALKQARNSQMVLGRLAPVEKVASFLLMLSARLEEHGQSTDPLPLVMTRTDIADYLGLTIETVSRSFTKLRMQGLIRLPDSHLVEIVNRRALIAVAGLDLPA